MKTELHHKERRERKESGVPSLRSLRSLWLIAIAFLLVVGCKTTPDRIAYETAQTTITVETALQLWDTYVEQKHPGIEIETKVKAAYDKYRAADIALLKAGKAMLEASAQEAGTQTPDAALAWQQAEAALAASWTDLIALLKSCGLKL